MPRKFNRDRIGRALDDLHGLLGRIKVTDSAPTPETRMVLSAPKASSMPTQGGEDELLAVTATPTEQGEDELLTISVLAP